MEWMLMPLRRYADFSGRSRRKEYWMFTLGIILAYFLIGLVFAVAGGFTGLEGPNPQIGAVGWLVFALFAIVSLALIVPSIAVQVRRLHDQDKSGWFILLGLIPYIGGVIMFVFMCIEGTKGENRYGPDPKGVSNLGEVFS